MKTDAYKTCHKCGGVMLPQTKDKIFLAGSIALKIDGVETYICQTCGEEVLDAKEVRDVERQVCAR